MRPLFPTFTIGMKLAYRYLKPRRHVGNAEYARRIIDSVIVYLCTFYFSIYLQIPGEQKAGVFSQKISVRVHERHATQKGVKEKSKWMAERAPPTA